MRRVIFIIFLYFFLFCPDTLFAKDNSYITIVNPQRISSYTKDYLASFKEEKTQVEKRNLPATWLVTYDVLAKMDFVLELRKLDTKQELGIFLEVTPQFAKEAGTTYNRSSSWHYANSLFLSGYKQNERKNLIDTVFKKFKKEFGYYPVSVGGWWVDAFSLSYMKEKYGITGVLGVSDQYDLDNYSVWGTWWSIPYYPNKNHAGLPAQTSADKLDIVAFRWASRDPLNGYSNPYQKAPSLYSTQDYPTSLSDFSYFQSLIELYSEQKPYNRFGQITVGLEGDLDKDIYQNQLSAHLSVVSSMEKEGKITATTMKEFSNWYRKSFPYLSPPHIIATPDLLEKERKTAIWFQTPYYRIGIVYDASVQKTYIIDLRAYQGNLYEPNYMSPNKQLNLSINLPYIIDSVIDARSTKILDLGQLKNIEQGKLIFEKGVIEFKTYTFFINGKKITLSNKFPVSPSGIIYKDSSIITPFTMRRKFPFLPSFIPFFIPHSYFISQSEYDALQVLKKQSKGKVLAFDQNCLKCIFTSQYKPAAAAGQKSYITKYTNMPVEINISFLLSNSSKEAKTILKDKNIRYIYLTHYEDYTETLPFLPQDLGLKRVYQNANVTIWKTLNAT